MLITAEAPSAHTTSAEDLPELQDSPWERVVGAFAAIMAALLPIAIVPLTASTTFAPKLALLFIIAAAGTVPLVGLAIRSREALPARLALGFVAVAILSALLSPSKLVGFFGLYLWGEGVIFLYALAAAWAIGVSLGPQGRTWLTRGLLVGASVNAVAAIVQVVGHLTTSTADLSGFGLFQGAQADGMMGNPVHLEALLLGALALVVGPVSRARGIRALGPAALVALLSAGLECSSERFGVLLLVVVVLVAVWFHRWQAWKFVVSVAVGFGSAALAGAGAPLSQRVATATAQSTFGLRIHAWIAGVRGTLEHKPLLGFGPGEVRNALLLYQSKGFARTVPPGKYFTDMHDVGVNILVATGLIGCALAAAFIATASWRARGALLGFAALVLAVELVEPMNVGVTPLAFLALGAALGAARGRTPAFSPGPSRSSVAIGIALSILALLPAADLVAGDAAEHTAALEFSMSDAKLANRLVPIWPVTAQQLAEINAYESVVGPVRTRHQLLEDSRYWVGIAASRDPSDTELWIELSAADLSLGNLASAKADAQRAVADDPFGVGALGAEGTVDVYLNDWPAAVTAYKLAVSLAPGDTKVEAQLAAAERHNRQFFLGPGSS